MKTMTKRRKGLATTCNNISHIITTTISHDDLLLSVKDGDTDADEDVDDNEQWRYKKSSPYDLMMHIDGDQGQDVEPIAYHRHEEFQLYMTEKEVMGFMDEQGDL
jgi:hypothetical protein